MKLPSQFQIGDTACYRNGAHVIIEVVHFHPGKVLYDMTLAGATVFDVDSCDLSPIQ